MTYHHRTESDRLEREIRELDRSLDAMNAVVGLRRRSRAGFLRALRDYKVERKDHLAARID